MPDSCSLLLALAGMLEAGIKQVVSTCLYSSPWPKALHTRSWTQKTGSTLSSCL